MKTILITAVMLCIIIGVNAQQKTAKKAPAKTTTASKSSTKKTVSTKKVTGKTEFDELICYEDGPCTFGIHKGDTLVYAVNAAGKIYDLLIVPNKFDANTVADFNWVTTGAERKTGHVVIGAKAIKSSKRYMNSLPAGELKLSDASFYGSVPTIFRRSLKGKLQLLLIMVQRKLFQVLTTMLLRQRSIIKAGK